MYLEVKMIIKKIIMKEDYIKTENITLSASIKAHNFQVGVEMISPTQAVFLIPKTPITESLINSFWDGKLLVNPLAFTNAKFDLLRVMNQLKNSYQEKQR